jgi:RNA polymerase sigma-70 factor, ECF subfamily
LIEQRAINDPKFLEALRQGHRQAFAELVDATSQQIYRLALKMLGDPQDAEDVLQETYLKAFRSLPAFEGRSSLTTWLYRIAVNESLMMIRKRRPQVSIDETREDGEETEPKEIVDWCCLPEHELVSTEAKRFLDQSIARLSPALRAVFVLRDVEGLSIRDTAEALNITEMTVKTRLLRARLKLRNELTHYYGEKVENKKYEQP